MREEAKKRRCAIYTRKSTEEGLEQEFNSLDAQREACRAYVMSQAHEGWQLDETIYDDGGFSGGNMERPALNALLGEVKAGNIDVIVVYKVDRLTRSLSDFARIVDVMDEAGASFVSVTQSFNTTTSMGRLTLNVLLSFAQFEREVTSERIRDKFAASKKKGMFMGGPIPLGYRLEDRKLYVEPDEAKTVNLVFETFLECGCMAAACERLERLGVKTKLRTYLDGRVVGGKAFTRGGLQHLLRNKIYRGMMVHKGKAWPGEHDPIVDEELWQKVQDRLDGNDGGGREGLRAKAPSLLNGLLKDEHGRRLVANHATKKTKRYRYYVTGQDQNVKPDIQIMRIPAHDLETAVIDRLREFLTDQSELARHFDPEGLKQKIKAGEALASALHANSLQSVRETLQSIVSKITVAEEGIEIVLRRDWDWGEATSEITLNVKAVKISSGGETKLMIASSSNETIHVDEKLAMLLAESYLVREEIVGGRSVAEIAAERNQTPQWVGKLLRIGWLPPQLVGQVLDGKKAANVTRRKLSQTAFRCVVWKEQMVEVIGW
ncbi:Site-specific DNA recombinase [Parasphingorhabdus marina DSM 22363]|uniref:Site-specific DNA recombinase n=1 Tax=Parasphingorhabdus marina DSM 22363 TaxID=1123272 RepID=A0A1N6D4Y8_9SPHN|nr:recombinase family protein [Parasphingorhabdus marina]SIN65714.1 Site-specific DNA recombinase [Parasphingorhabdus marina DSM 22363]